MNHLKVKPTSMKCTPLGKFKKINKRTKQNTAEKCIYKHARTPTKSGPSEAEETGRSHGFA